MLKPIDYVVIAIVAAWFVGSCVYFAVRKKKGYSSSCCHCCDKCRAECKRRDKVE